MRDWKQFRIEVETEIYFCDPNSPRQRGINDNTNGLLRQYFPTVTDLSTLAELDLDADLDQVVDQVNERPANGSAFDNPNEHLAELPLHYRQGPPTGRPRCACDTARLSSRGQR